MKRVITTTTMELAKREGWTREEVVEVIRAGVLSPREKLVFVLRSGYAPALWGLEEIGELIGLSRERVRKAGAMAERRMTNAVRRMREEKNKAAAGENND